MSTFMAGGEGGPSRAGEALKCPLFFPVYRTLQDVMLGLKMAGLAWLVRYTQGRDGSKVRRRDDALFLAGPVLPGDAGS